MKTTLILFDIDGTLLSMKGAGREAFVRTIKEVTGVDHRIDYINFWGATDLDVLHTILGRLSIAPDDELVEAFFSELPRQFAKTVHAAQTCVFPGVEYLLEQLSERADVVLGLVTGNIEACARIKLEQVHLHNHFMLGAFGHEHADRTEIARLALDRAKRYANTDRFFNTWLIGDTPSDIDAAKAIQAGAVGVATGTYSTEDLSKAGADHVLENLADHDGILKLLGLDDQ